MGLGLSTTFCRLPSVEVGVALVQGRGTGSQNGVREAEEVFEVEPGVLPTVDLQNLDFVFRGTQPLERTLWGP